MSKNRKTANKSGKGGINTRLAHIGNDPRDFHGYVNPPVVRASTILYPDYETMRDRTQKYHYGISGTPTTEALTDALTELEGAAGSVLVPSGLAAISVPVLCFAESGMHMLVVDSVYGPTRQFCQQVLAPLGVEVEYFSPHLGTEFSKLMRPNTGMVLLEAPASNSFEMCDVPLLTTIAHEHNKNCVVMMDNTWATPLYFKPLDHGVDVSIHALSKYPAGHADILMGGISANQKCFAKLRRSTHAMGMCVGGDDAYLVLRSMRSMAVRMRHHEKSTLEICQWLQGHKQVSRVLYPALPEDPGHELWQRDFKGASGLFSFVIKDSDQDQAGAFLNALNIFALGYSWAGYESLAVMPGFSDRQICHGPAEGTAIRLQIGLEDAADLMEDIDQALSAIDGS
ncbi:MAG: cystathionine beta-lyase [Rhizobiaceae bacterium]